MDTTPPELPTFILPVDEDEYAWSIARYYLKELDIDNLDNKILSGQYKSK